MKKGKLNFLAMRMRGSAKYFVGAVVFILAGSLFAFSGPKLIGVAVDSIIGNAPFDLPRALVNLIDALGGRRFFLSHIYIVIRVFALIKAAEAGCEYTRLYCSNHLGENLAYNMRRGVFENLQRATYAYHKSIYTGDIIQRCSSDIETVRMFVLEMTDIFRVVSKIVVAYRFMAAISWRLAIVSFITVPLISFFSVVFSSRIQKKFTMADEEEGKLQARAQENLSAPLVIRAFGKQKQERDGFVEQNREYSRLWVKVGALSAWYWSTGDFLTVAQVVTVLCAGTYFAVKGYITPGEIISFMIYNNMLAWPIRSLGRIVGDMAKATVALGRIAEVYDCDREDYQTGLNPRIKGDIEFKNVCFSFGRQKIFDNLSFKVSRGQTVAILGRSGSGKSTILALLARFYKPDSGSITIDGIDIEDINLHTLRKAVGIVMQEPFLFGKSIKENISITDKKPDMDRVRECARIASVNTTIENFPRGYDTPVGERGVTLSGGQKQRVAIARTLYAGSKILCFDDSLSAVDSLTDANIRRQLKERVKGLTTIIISQRVNTLMEADRILVLDGGRIVQQGTHSQLLSRGGIYRDIVKIQSDIIRRTKQEARQ